MKQPANAFAAADSIVAPDEGGLSLDPNDSGNWSGASVGVGTLKGTKYGISAAAYPDLDIAALTPATAQEIRFTDYWAKAKCGLLAWPLCLVVYDGEINSGSYGAKALQEALGFTGGDVDGDIGPITLHAVNGWNPVELAAMTYVKRALFYVSLSQPADLTGWLKRIFLNAFEAGDPTALVAG